MTKSAMEVPVLDFVRPNLRKLEPYRCARDDYDSGTREHIIRLANCRFQCIDEPRQR
jgi:hypothetical protein